MHGGAVREGKQLLDFGSVKFDVPIRYPVKTLSILKC